MPNDSKPSWWRLRRVRWPMGALLGVAGAIAVAVVNSELSHIIVYNESGHSLAELTIRACGQSETFHDVRGHESVRLTLDASGAESEITIETNGVSVWHGEYIEPRGGYRSIVHLRRDGQVEATTSVSWWQSLLHSNSGTEL